VPDALVRFSISHPRLILLLWLSLGLTLSPGILHLEIDTSTDSVLDRQGEDWAFYQTSQQIFGGDEIIVVAIRSDDAFSPDALVSLERLSREFESLGGVERVDSLSTLPVVTVNSLGDVSLDPALSDLDEGLSAAIDRARILSGIDRIIPRTLLSEDGRTAALSLILDRGVERQHEEILEHVASKAAVSGALISGVPVFRVETNRKTRSEILQFAPITASLLALFLFCFFRSVRAVLIGLLPGVVGAAVSVCVMGLSGVPISITTMILPSMLIALGCAYSMHVLLAVGGAKGASGLASSIRPLSLPLALSGLTTVVGLVSLSVIRIDAVRHAGIYGAIGVLTITAFSLTSLPAILTLSPLGDFANARTSTLAANASERIVSLLERQRVLTLSLWFVLACGLTLGLTQLHVETDPTTWLGPGDPVRDSYEAIRADLSGISPMNVVVTATDGKSVLEPTALRSIDLLADYLESQPEVGRAISIADPLRQLNGGFENDPLMPLPLSRVLSEQYMLLLDSVELIHNVISSDRTSANVMLRVDDNGSADILSVASRAEDWWAMNGPPGYAARTTGIMFEFARAEDAIAYGQLAGLGVALSTIFVILLLFFRQPLVAFIAMLPNALPLVIVFGVMGLLGIPLDAGTALIGGLALGIAVDDTVHLMTSFVDAIERGNDTRDALTGAFERVLPAVLSSTAMVSVGFGVFIFSEFSLTKNLGWLTSSIMVVCVVADITLLGALIVGRDWGQSRSGAANRP
jgi:uncharacterized protein